MVVFLALAGFFFASKQSKDKDVIRLQNEATQLRTSLEEATNSPAQNEPSPLSAAERTELIRLRNAVGILRHEKEQLATQALQTKQTSEKLLQSQQAQQSQVQQLQQQNQQLAQQTQQAQGDKAKNNCINNLRQIDGAKQQWALENKQPADAVVAAQQIAPYLKDSAIPKCPGGGTYTLHDISAAPTCSISSHVLQ